MDASQFQSLLAAQVPDNTIKQVTPSAVRTVLTSMFDAKQASIAPAAALTANATNAPTNLPTNLNTVTTLLGVLTSQMNATNANVNTVATMLNTLATNQNAIIAALKAQGLMSA